MIALLDPLIKHAVLRFGSPVDDKHPKWLCQLVDGWLDRYLQQNLHQPFLQAQAEGIGIARRHFPPGSEAEPITAWVSDEIEHTPPFPGLDWFRVFLFAAPESVLAPLNDETIRYEWTGPRADWLSEYERFAAIATAEAHGGVYAVVNGAGSTLRTVVRSS